MITKGILHVKNLIGHFEAASVHLAQRDEDSLDGHDAASINVFLLGSESLEDTASVPLRTDLYPDSLTKT